MKSRLRKHMLFAMLAVSIACRSSAASPAGPQRVVSIEGIAEYRIHNGLRVLLVPDHSKPTLTVNITYLVGSRHEGAGETGMAHLLEHMLFKGTVKHPDLWAELEQRGATCNGTTWVDRTNYFETLPATEENLRFAIELEADRMLNSKIAAVDLAKEFTVVRNEFERAENRPSRILHERMLASAYVWHGYGRATLGSKSDIERVPAQSLRAFYQRYYQPDNALLVVAGRFDPEKALAIIEATFGRLPRPVSALPPTYTVEPVQDGERAVVLRRTGDVGIAGLLYHGVAGADPRFEAEEAVVDILTHQATGRLYRKLVSGGHAASVRGDAYSWMEPGVLAFYAEVPSGQPLEPVRDEMIRTVESLARDGITDAEVERYKASVLRDFELTLTDADNVGIALSEWAAQGDWRLLFAYRDRVRSLKTKDVRAFAAGFLVGSNRTSGLFIPTKEPVRAPLPPSVDVAAIAKGYKEAMGAAEGESFDATWSNIEKRTTRYTLDSGVKVALLPKKTRGGVVNIYLRMRAGDKTSLAGRQALVELLPDALVRGTRRRSFQNVQDELARLSVEWKVDTSYLPDLDPGTSAMQVKTVSRSATEALALVTELLKEPSFPDQAVDELVKEKRARYEAQLQDPYRQTLHSLGQTLRPWGAADARHMLTLQERVDALRRLKPVELRAFHKAYWGGGGLEVAVVGDFDQKAILELLTAQLGNWRTMHPHQQLELEAARTAVTDKLIVTPDKAMASIGLVAALPIRDDDAEYPALMMASALFGEGFNSRMVRRLRQAEGYSYGAWSWLTDANAARSTGFFSAALCAAENTDKAMTALLEELSLFSDHGVSMRELEDAKRRYKEQIGTYLASDSWVARLLVDSLDRGRTLEFDEHLEERVRELVPAVVNRVVAKYLKPEQLAKVRAGDLRKKN